MQQVLALLARLTLKRYKPLVVGITGSAGKTSAKEATFAVLSRRWRVRASEKNYNTEIGVPLAVLGIPHHGRNVFRWLFAFIRVAFRVLIRGHEYPQVLVLEMAADRPGDIGYLAALAPPRIGLITGIGEVPVHVEFFAGPLALAAEKANLIAALPPDGWAILNADDPVTLNLRSKTRAAVTTYGFALEATLHISDYALWRNGEGSEAGIRFRLWHRGASAAVELRNTFGRQQALASAAAAAVGAALGMGLEEASRALAGYEAPAGRLKLIRGNKSSYILDDTYNASPAAVAAALEVLRDFPARRRIAVLGDMLELGRFSEPAHRAAGEGAAQVVDVFIAIGERMRFAAASAEAMASRTGRPEVLWFPRAEEGGRKLEGLLSPGDVALVKGSQGMRMEKVVREVMAEPERAGELLVRQDGDWLERP